MAGGKVGRMDTFDGNLESWDSYSERLEQYFICNDVKDEKKVAVLLTVIGAKAYSLVRDLTAPTKPFEVAYEELIQILRAHLCPKPLVIAERFRFYKRNQEETESVRDYISQLRKLSEHCEYGQSLKETLRDKLVCGLRSEHIQKKLLAEADLTLDRAIEIAVTMEMAAKDATELRTKHLSAGVNKIQFKKKFRQTESKKTLDKKCFRCDGRNHEPNECFYKDQECFRCKKKGHCKKACKGFKKVHAVTQDSEEEYVSTLVVEVNTVRKHEGVIMVTPKVDNIKITMELDTGAGVTVMPKSEFMEKYPGELKKLVPSDVTLKTYSGEILETLGMKKVKVEYKGQQKILKLYVVEKGGRSLFGRDWLKHINLDWSEIKSITSTYEDSKLEKILEDHHEVFKDDLGTVKGVKATLNLKSGATPKFFKPRSVAYAIKPKVECELDNLVKQGILTRCDYSEWATPIVPVIKKNGSVRICGDFKVTVNPVLEVDQYPLPRIEDIFAALSGGKHFSKLDLKHAYLQLEVDEACRHLLTINTEKGLYRFNRLVYGIASAPAIWQRTMDMIFEGLSGVKCIIDDMIVTGRTDEEHQRNLNAVLERLDTYGLRVNKAKCEFFKEKVQFCGHEIDRNGLHKTQSKIEAVVKAKQPTNVTELRSFLGIVNYYSRFLPNLSTVLYPLHKLLEKSRKWHWTSSCEKSFNDIKELITSNKVLTHYDPDLPIRLATDASPFGLGAVLSHVMKDGSERPIAYASRTLSAAEKNYSQIDKEALGIVWGVKRFNLYLYGRHFCLLTDHQPLVSIFHPHKGIPTTSAARLQRQAVFLSGHDYEIEYKNTKKHGNADSLSRLPSTTHLPREKVDAVEIFHISQFDRLPVKVDQIQRETSRDPVLAVVYNSVMSGWTNEPRNPEIEAYFTRRNELTVHQGCLLWGIRVVIPPSLRSQLLDELHVGHIGVVKMKAVARSHIWWPGIDKSIENLSKSCTGCQEVKHSPPAAPIHPWEWPTKPWERIHIDFAGPFLSSMFLIIVDAHSKWPEVIQMKSTTSERTIEVLRTVFARNGIPYQIVSDNGPQFVSEEFKNFVKRNGIRHTTSAPYHPSTNGLAERFVQSFKMAMKSSANDSGFTQKKLANFLLSYRNAPQATTNETPAMLFMGRNLHSRLDLVKPNLHRRVIDQQNDMREKRHTRVPTYSSGDLVSVRDYRHGNRSWTPGTITSQTGPVSYHVNVNGGTWRRHADQLRPNEIRQVHEPTIENQSDLNDKSISQEQSIPDTGSGHPVAPNTINSQTKPIEPRYPKRDRKPPKYLKDYAT